MDNEAVKNKDPIQLQQMIIFLKAELAKYKNEANRLRNSDYNSLVLRLERENMELVKQKKELSLEILKLKRENERKLKAYHENIQAMDTQKRKQISSIERLLKQVDKLRAENKLIKETLKLTINQFFTIKSDANYKITADYFENKWNTFTREMNLQMTTINEAFERFSMDQANSEKHNKYLLKEIEKKSYEIENLTEELAEEKKNKSIIQPDSLSQMDFQVKKVLAESISFEKQLDQKLRLLDDLDEKLNMLSIDINKEKNV
ncbi:hypothetical protein M3603_07265 [Rummeliibacillus stabekisii]|uniref:hypothetical protein n=1 Tax=Rummeliibacillus stabekisii TaxID=241244 RepID=UPI00203B5502|nr:hypothetical protein [Rummeliibacillus stabekisii]MCM3316476.1 hypothetical protein [Rummeliibacillus stabekisii]